jgi:hypothetical protein
LVSPTAVRIPVPTTRPAMKTAAPTILDRLVQFPSRNNSYTVLGLWTVALGLLGLTVKGIMDSREHMARSLEHSKVLQKIKMDYKTSQSHDVWWNSINSLLSLGALGGLVSHSLTHGSHNKEVKALQSKYDEAERRLQTLENN